MAEQLSDRGGVQPPDAPQWLVGEAAQPAAGEVTGGQADEDGPTRSTDIGLSALFERCAPRVCGSVVRAPSSS
ncbi:hypothetical protein A6A27_18325 [Micromonospora sp. CB01531]|nr:hypothetical protein A6A27_18325 [Micromonospora sp. CB01531]